MSKIITRAKPANLQAPKAPAVIAEKRPATPKAGPVTVKSDKDVAAERNKPARAQLLQAIESAEIAAGEALLAALRGTITLGPTSKDEVAQYWPSCNNPAVYSSWFNLGNRAMLVVGEKLALEAITRACEGKGQAFKKAREALVKIVDTARKATGITAGKAGCELTGRAAAQAVTAAVTAAKSAATAPKAAPAKRGPTKQQTATLAAAAVESGKGARELGAFMRLASQQAHRMAAPEGMESAWRDAVKSLEDTAEKFAAFLK